MLERYARLPIDSPRQIILVVALITLIISPFVLCIFVISSNPLLDIIKCPSKSISIASDIVRSHGGNIKLEKSSMNDGLCVRIFLPF